MSDYDVIERSAVIDAEPSRILPLLTDLRAWQQWSPWEGLDPELQRTYTGPETGPGARYVWSGNRKAGAGTMQITDASDRSVDIDLAFTRPFKSQSKVRFDLAPSDAGTTVVWSMRTPRTLMTRVFGVFMNLERVIGRDLEKGLAQLQEAAQAA
mgnify:FL=1